jgi:2-amino-4-hydroxy-6-hydroxymethyldihydropteridine diphosphokinase
MTAPVELTAYVALGSNLSGRWASSQEVLNAANHQLLEIFGSTLQCSSYFETCPVNAAGPNFVNAVVSFKTKLDPLSILKQLQAIENSFGRERPFPNAPRVLDLDLLACQWSSMDRSGKNSVRDFRVVTSTLTLPHPRLHERAFVVVPLSQIAPTFAIEGLGNVSQWIDKTKDQTVVPL